ncbi:type VI secretion system protein ImpJ [Bryocella elongata]|uniref:Type VI secretion system protein ImpJ n=1 Tax=Bryocella elongata TaxID=863522 RepID=A0A1H6ACM9_9BACT|nr:type VI secretion system baseplate subunit TssK [Bryocella elongata]SEG46231.1 type VI secretion system protein ImpJ [Bryocella elongata]
MRQLQPVVWSKGTFLSPQHLQAQERFVEESVRFYLDSLIENAWGFSQLRVDAKALSEGNLALSEASGVFGDSLPFEFPGADPIPDGRALAKCFEPGQKSCTFYLAIPEYRPGGVNVAMAPGPSTRFSAQQQMLRDENSGDMREKPVRVAQKNLKLIAEGQPQDGFVVMPCARVLRSDTGSFALDPSFVPTLINVRASNLLENILRGLVEILVARSTRLSGNRRQKNQRLADFSSSDIAEFWLLYTVNTHLPGFRHLQESERISPAQLFTQMADLAGSLATFSNTLVPRDFPVYVHEEPGPGFIRLDEIIRSLLDTVVPTNFVALQLKFLRDSIYATSIDKDEYLHNTRLYLAVSADMREPDIIDRVPKLMKVCSATHVEHLVRQALPGLKLSHVQRPPRGIALKVGHQYFAMEQSGPVWESIQRARNFAVYAPQDFLRPEMELIVLLPSAGAN